MRTTRYRTAALVGDGVNLDAGASAQFNVTIVVHAVLVIKAEELYDVPQASACTAYDDQREARQRHRRVFVPTVQLLCEHLPQPEV